MSSGNHDSRLSRLEKWRQQLQQQQHTATSGNEAEDSHSYDPASIVVFQDMDPNETRKPIEQRRIDHLVSRLRAEAQAAHYTGRWDLAVRVAEDGALEVSGPPWWNETPAAAQAGGFDAARALASITGFGSRRYS